MGLLTTSRNLAMIESIYWILSTYHPIIKQRARLRRAKANQCPGIGLFIARMRCVVCFGELAVLVWVWKGRKSTFQPSISISKAIISVSSKHCYRKKLPSCQCQIQIPRKRCQKRSYWTLPHFQMKLTPHYITGLDLHWIA